MSFLKIFIIIFFVSFNSNVLAKSIDEKFKEADNLIEIDQTKDSFRIIKKNSA